MVSLKLGSTLAPDEIKEGDDVYFECSIQSNPKYFRLAWTHNGAEVSRNTTAGVVFSDHSLILRNITKDAAGEYSCLAANSQGKGFSNFVNLSVRCKYRGMHSFNFLLFLFHHG